MSRVSTMKIVPATIAMVITCSDSIRGNHSSAIATASGVPCNQWRNSAITGRLSDQVGDVAPCNDDAEPDHHVERRHRDPQGRRFFRLPPRDGGEPDGER